MNGAERSHPSSSHPAAKESCTCSYGKTLVPDCIEGPQCKETGGYQTDVHTALYVVSQRQDHLVDHRMQPLSRTAWPGSDHILNGWVRRSRTQEQTRTMSRKLLHDYWSCRFRTFGCQDQIQCPLLVHELPDTFRFLYTVCLSRDVAELEAFVLQALSL